MTGAPQTRSRRSGWSVRTRILASILIVAAFGLAGAGATTFLVQRERTMQAVDDRLLTRVAAVRSVLTGTVATVANPDAPQATATPDPGVTSAPTEGGDPGASEAAPAFTSTRQAMRAVLARVIPNSNESALGIIDGVAAFAPGVDTDFELQSDPAFVARIVDEVGTGTVRLGTAQSPLGLLRYIAVPVTLEGATDRGIYVAAVNVDSELAPLDSSFRTYTVTALVALAAIGLVGWFVAGRLLRPIRQLRAAASRITASDRQERIPVTGRDDVSDLTATVNGMLDRLDGAMTAQRQLLDDVRHELKTPITILRGHLELLDSGSAAEVEQVRTLALDELDRMSGLVDDIESLAESRRDEVVLLPVDVADLTRDVFAKAAAMPGHEWLFSGAAEAIVHLDSGRITQAWLQLADNAAKYSPDGAPIEIGSSANDLEVEFWVSDRGNGIPPAARERIFERFGRVDTGRGIRGSGLGLPIVKAIAEAHGGRVSLASSPSGSRFGVVVPRDRDDSAIGAPAPEDEERP